MGRSVERLAQARGGSRRIGVGQDGGDHGHSSAACSQDAIQVVDADAADGQHRYLYGLDDLAQLAQAAGWQAGVGCGRKDVAEGHVVGAAGGGVCGFGEAVDGASDEEPASGQANGRFHGHALAGQMHTLGADGERDVQSVVDGQVGAVLVRDAQQLLRVREQGRG